MEKEIISPKKRYVLRAEGLGETDSEIAQLRPKPMLREKAQTPGLGLDQVIDIFLDGYGDRPALGERTYEVRPDAVSGKLTRHYLASYSTISYRALQERIKAVSMAWRSSVTCAVNRDDFVLIMGFADTDFTVLDMACTYSKAVTVPVQSSTSGADLSEIVANIEPVAIAATLNDLLLATALAVEQDTVKSIIVFNYDDRVEEEKKVVDQAKAQLATAQKGKQLYSIKELIEIGKKEEWTFLTHDDRELEKRAAIIHSSGSTGKPKGAVIAQHAFIHNWLGRKTVVPKVTVLLAPLNHIMGRLNLMNVLNCGGTGYFTLKPDLSSLLEDIRLARPTYLSLFPRIFELIYQHFQSEVALRYKNGIGDKESIEDAVKKEMRKTYLGDRLLMIAFGSAPTSPKVQRFIGDCFDVLMMEGYGNTESGSGSLTLDGKIERRIVLDYKLRDVPELGYFTTDKPFPRGELCVKTKYGIKEYYKQPETTAALFDEEGFSCTGDIVEETGPDEIVVIDRRKDVLKLSQGEYVAVGNLGTVFEAGSAVVQQIYVYGNSQRSYLLAVVVPAMEVLHQMIGDQPKESHIKNLIRDELNKVALKEDLKNFEIPRDFIIEQEAFSQENGLLSSVRKRLRPALKRKYGAALEAIYEAHDQADDTRLATLKDPDSKLTTLEKLVILLESQLNITGMERETPRSFNELGGDSLGAALFSLSIEEMFDVHLPADVLLSPTGHLKAWAKYIDEARNPNRISQVTFDAIHGKGRSVVSAEDLRLEQFIDADLLARAATLPMAPESPKTVFLTGANGFLGHIVCLQWLKILAQNEGTLICLVRENNDTAAYEKLAREFRGLDPIFEKTFQELAPKHLKVIAGDIGQPFLGLDEKVFNRLVGTVDRICHVAALVNHRLAYTHLFGPNVVGTTEIIKMAISKVRKPIDFISTVGVFMLLDTTNGINEQTVFRKKIKLSDHYASGYATSKWAGEILLQKIHKHCGVPVNVFRCDMILPDQQYKGQANVSDMLTRLLYSIVLTGLAPTSFYKRYEEKRPMAHYEGVPVDVLAKAITGVHKMPHKEYRLYHAVNYLKDDVSLDRFVDWIETAGYPIHRIPEHSEWYHRMKTKLKTLPEEQRQASALDILMAYSRPLRAGNSMIGAANFKNLVESLDELGALPGLSEKYLHKYLKDLEILGMV